MTARGPRHRRTWTEAQLAVMRSRELTVEAAAERFGVSQSFILQQRRLAER